MPFTLQLTLREALHLAAKDELREGWLYLPSPATLTLDTPCLLVDDADDTAPLAAGLGFPQEGLDTGGLLDVAQCAANFEYPVTDELLLESFVYFWRFDAWLPHPGAPDPPPWEETKRILDREFYELLGPERTAIRCKRDGCNRGAITASTLCRPHHFEMIKNEACPFDD